MRFHAGTISDAKRSQASEPNRLNGLGEPRFYPVGCETNGKSLGFDLLNITAVIIGQTW
jgi:hypothetical protein